MKEDKLSELSMQLSVDVLNLAEQLRAKHETVISNQISRSATSVCANIAESKYGHSRADFIAKLQIALKEAGETGKWLEMPFLHVLRLRFPRLNAQTRCHRRY
jgi:four helix bundle protein